MTESVISEDTKATLLLCGRFGPRHSGAKPLTPGEFHVFAPWLEKKGVNPSALLRPGIIDRIRRFTDAPVRPTRLVELMSRGQWLSTALEGWSRSGIWVIGEFDSDYPSRLGRRLKTARSPLLFGAGPRALLDQGGLCVVGSRDSGAEGIEFARDLGGRCGREGITVISSDMRGVDREATSSALAEGGRVVSVVTDRLEKSVAARRNREALEARKQVLITPFSPDTRFSVSNAMRANKYQYALADAAVIVETRRQGGVWSGADENRNEGWVPAFVHTGQNTSPGNTALLHLGFRPITGEDVATADDLRSFFLARAMSPSTPPPASEQQPASRPGETFDLYTCFIAELERLLGEGACSEKEVIAHFLIERIQARKWLRRAENDGHILRTQRPVRYRKFPVPPNSV